ncbi:solute carrier family 28 member 3-like [Trichosurus vulpecula]|uniref:solute carrier family 28 member 3-like n=1 Tax=Trichosurus vulpecula TaxID=9337 RepID=UPI00186AD094|nr:solute carrier family 28 member 3-like [Trichosurus vulpecula]
MPLATARHRANLSTVIPYPYVSLQYRLQLLSALKDSTPHHYRYIRICSFNYPLEEDIKNQSESGRYSLRNCNECNGDRINAHQGEEHITIEQDLPKQKGSIEENERTHLKGYLEKKYDEAYDFFRKHKAVTQYIFYGILLAGFLILVTAACVVNFHRALPLFVFTVAAIFFVLWDYLIAKYESQIAVFWSPGGRFLSKHWFWLKWLMWILLVVGIICWLIFDTAKQGTQSLVSFGGLVFYVLLMLIFSKYPTRVFWRSVFWGIGLQFLLGLLILRTTAGFEAFNWLGNQVQIFLESSDTGAIFVFGDNYIEHFFAFKVNMIAFLALLAFTDLALSWLGNMFDYPRLNFEVICSYVFMPLSFMMGVDWEDSFLVGTLIGYKTFINEFIAFQQLAKLIKLRKLAGPKFVDGVQQYMSVRSETIATYALCGFSSFGSLGVMIAGLTSMAPSRKQDIAAGAFRALIAGTVASFMTACVAGILSSPTVEIDCYSLLENAFNSISPSNTTELVTCCQNLFTSAVSNITSDILPASLSTFTGCCLLLNQSTPNCDWVTTSF